MSKLTDKQKIDILNYSIEEAKEIIEDLRNQNAELRDELDLKNKVIGLMANQLSIASDRYEYMEETEIIEYFYKKVEE